MKQFLCMVFPFLFRMCPFNQIHTRWDNVCDCVKGNEFVWDRRRKMWAVEKYYVKYDHTSSPISFSGAMTTSDLLSPAVKLGLAIGVCCLSIMYLGFVILTTSAKQARDNIEIKLNNAQK